jgi:hypothetical protein
MPPNQIFAVVHAARLLRSNGSMMGTEKAPRLATELPD